MSDPILVVRLIAVISEHPTPPTTNEIIVSLTQHGWMPTVQHARGFVVGTLHETMLVGVTRRFVQEQENGTWRVNRGPLPTDSLPVAVREPALKRVSDGFLDDEEEG